MLTDSSGEAYGAVPDGLVGALGERELPAGQSARGLIGFVVPRVAQGLILDYHAELGDESATVPLT